MNHYLAGVAGLEPADAGVKVPCLNRLGYTPKGTLTGNALSSQSVSRQVLSAYECLTTVFGMGTGGTTQLSSPDIQLNVMHIQNYTEEISCRTF